MDIFEDIREQEQAVIRDYRMKLDGNERAINLANRLLSIKNAPGYQEIVQAFEDLRQHVIRQMISSSATGDDLLLLKGKGQALTDVLAIIKRTESAVEQLAAVRETLENGLKLAQSVAPKAG